MMAGAVVVSGVGILIHDRFDLSANYTQVKAQITTVEVDCFIKNRRGKIVDKRTNELAYMSCEIAPIAAHRHGYNKHDIKKRAKVTYDYISPVDDNYYSGEFTRTGNVDVYVTGKEIPVYAHRENPKDSRTGIGNI